MGKMRLACGFKDGESFLCLARSCLVIIMVLNGEFPTTGLVKLIHSNGYFSLHIFTLVFIIIFSNLFSTPIRFS